MDVATTNPAPGNQTHLQLLRERFALIADINEPYPEGFAVLQEIRHLLETGDLRVAEPAEAGWIVHAWVKQALIKLSAYGRVALQAGSIPGTELDTLPWRISPFPGCRIPAGSLIRHGAYLAPGVAIMPPTTVQIGAYVNADSMIDSHTLIGTCTQIGKSVSIGCGTMIGGVLLPPEAPPTIIEDHVFIGGSCGIYDGVRIGARSIVNAGTILSAHAGIFDVASGTLLMAGPDGALAIPPGSIVSMGVPTIKAGDGYAQIPMAMIIGNRERHQAEV